MTNATTAIAPRALTMSCHKGQLGVSSGRWLVTGSGSKFCIDSGNNLVIDSGRRRLVFAVESFDAEGVGDSPWIVDDTCPTPWAVLVAIS